MKTLFLIPILICNLLIVSAQDSVFIELDSSFNMHMDTTWNVDNIDLRLHCDWGPDYIQQREGLKFGGSLTTKIDNFQYKIDSIEIINLDVCSDCTSATFYKTGYSKRKFTIVKDTTMIINPWDFNPDSVVFSAGEALFRYQMIYFDEATSIEQGINDNKIKISPNPSKYWINVSSTNSNIKSWNIYNQAGRLVFSNSSNSYNLNKLEKINIEQLSVGVYFIEVQMNSGKNELMKFIKI